jgi:altronate hydrolase
MRIPAIRLSEADNVAVAVRDLKSGEEIDISGVSVVTREPVPLGHKIAIRRIETGTTVVKLGVPIGSATQVIEKGALAHMHNIQSDYLNNEEYHWE